jgi:hypothetical protein
MNSTRTLTEAEQHLADAASHELATKGKAKIESAPWLTTARRKVIAQAAAEADGVEVKMTGDVRKLTLTARQVTPEPPADLVRMLNEPIARSKAASTKAPTVHNDRVDWQPSETGDADSFDATANGYLMTVWKDDSGAWYWLVKATAEISETPETIDGGSRPGKTGAERAACTCVNRQR